MAANLRGAQRTPPTFYLTTRRQGHEDGLSRREPWDWTRTVPAGRFTCRGVVGAVGNWRHIGHTGKDLG